jgi:hypothetical protein
MKYGYFCEDTALKVFIEAVLDDFKKGKFERHEVFCDRFELPVGGNDKTIDRRYVEISQEARVFGLDLFIVARDYDNKSLKPAEYDRFIESFKEKLHIKIRNRTLFCVPVKCIEYWLYYVKHWDDDEPPKKNSLEINPDFNCQKAKADVYEGVLDEGKYQKLSRETETNKARIILKNLNIKKLRGYSASFDSFIRQLELV